MVMIVAMIVCMVVGHGSNLVLELAQAPGAVEAEGAGAEASAAGAAEAPAAGAAAAGAAAGFGW